MQKLKRMKEKYKKNYKKIGDKYKDIDIFNLRQSVSQLFCMLFYFFVLTGFVLVFIFVLLLFFFNGTSKQIYLYNQYHKAVQNFKHNNQQTFLKSNQFRCKIYGFDLDDENKNILEFKGQLTLKVNSQKEYESYQHYLQIKELKSKIEKLIDLAKEAKSLDQLSSLENKNTECLQIEMKQQTSTSQKHQSSSSSSSKQQNNYYKQLKGPADMKCANNLQGVNVGLLRLKPQILEGVRCNSQTQCQQLCEIFIDSKVVFHQTQQNNLYQDNIICYGLQVLDEICIQIEEQEVRGCLHNQQLSKYNWYKNEKWKEGVELNLIDKDDPMTVEYSQQPLGVRVRQSVGWLALLCVFSIWGLLAIYFVVNRGHTLHLPQQLQIHQPTHISQIQEIDLDQSINNDNNKHSTWNELESSMMR